MQKASVKLFLFESKVNQLGQMPIYLRLTVNRKSSYISTGYWIQKKHWDERMEQVKSALSIHEEINLDITNRKKQILQQLIDASIKGRNVTAKGLKEGEKKKLSNIFRFAEEFSKQVKNNRAGSTISNYEKHLRKLREFTGDELFFSEIDVDFLHRFEAYLRGAINNREGKNPNNYIDAILRTIRTLFNAARKKGIADNYPFLQYEMPKTSAGNKAYLTWPEIKLWHDFAMETTHPTLSQTAVYFLFGCYTGLRLSDWKGFGDINIKSGNISVKATKNKAWVAVPLHEGHLQLFKRMKEVPLTIKEPTINKQLKVVAKYLKIDKSLSTHSARRSFAVTMCLERGISAETAAKLMGITLAIFEKNYSFITPQKISLETTRAWKDLF